MAAFQNEPEIIQCISFVEVAADDEAVDAAVAGAVAAVGVELDDDCSKAFVDVDAIAVVVVAVAVGLVEAVVADEVAAAEPIL